MSAYKDALVIERAASDQRLALAALALAQGDCVVLFEGGLALRPAGRELLCEVIDPSPSERRCAQEYEVLVENAQRALDASPLSALLPRLPCRWIVVADYGTGTTELWRAM